MAGAALTSLFADILRLRDEDRRRLVICGISAGFAAVHGFDGPGCSRTNDFAALGHEAFEPDTQPDGGRKALQQGPSRTCRVVPLVNGEAMFGMGAAREHRRKPTPIAADQRVPDGGLNISKSHPDDPHVGVGNALLWQPLPPIQPGSANRYPTR